MVVTFEAVSCSSHSFSALVSTSLSFSSQQRAQCTPRSSLHTPWQHNYCFSASNGAAKSNQVSCSLINGLFYAWRTAFTNLRIPLSISKTTRFHCSLGAVPDNGGADAIEDITGDFFDSEVANLLLYGMNDEYNEENVHDTSLRKAVVKVFCISAEPDYSLPWQLQKQISSTGSGFIISGRRLLTNAHCVEHHTQVTVKKTGDDTKYIATVLAIGEECDLALLTVEDNEFWKDVKPLEFGGLPNLQDSVTVVGYPVGGNTVSVTKGVVSRVEVIPYVHGDSELLAVQIDAAINPGNSGGPAFNEEGYCVGIAFQGNDGAENIGYVIPTMIVHHFLKDYQRNGKYTGFPSLGFIYQKLENPHLRASLKMSSNQKGIFVRKLDPTSPAKNILREGDVVLSFDGVPISNEATVPLRRGERIALSFLVSQKFTGDQAVLGILRDGVETEVKMSLSPSIPLVPIHIKSRQPSYFIIAGLVFTVVTEALLQEEYSEDHIYAGAKIRLAGRFNLAEFEGQELILLSQVLAHSVNIGYERVSHLQVLKFNGTKIRNMKHFAELVDSCDTEYMQFELDDNVIVVLATDSARSATPQILKEYCIPHDRSQSLRTNGEVELDEIAS